MSESPESTSKPAPSNPPAPPGPPPPYWLYRLAAWVGIIAGIVFIVSSIFFAGVYVSKGGHHCHHGTSMFHKGHHDRGADHLSPGSEAPGPAQVPQSVTQPPPAPGR